MEEQSDQDAVAEIDKKARNGLKKTFTEAV